MPARANGLKSALTNRIARYPNGINTRVAANTQPLGTVTDFASDCDSYDRTDLKFKLQDHARRLLPEHRIRVCGRHISGLGGDVEIHHNAEKQSARYGNLMQCGNAWICPFCAARIGDERRRLLRAAVSAAAAQGIITVLATYTLSHQRGEPLAGIMSTMNDALRTVRSGRAYQDIKARFGIVGSVTTREITYGENGWHPHVHELLFIKADALQGDTRLDLSQALAERWLNSLEKHGGTATLEHGFDLKTDATPEYISKYGREDLRTQQERESGGWMIEHEMTKAAAKISKNKAGRTPLQLLRDSMARDTASGLLFIEYAAAVRGKTQFKFSSGLLELLEVDADNLPAENADTADSGGLGETMLCTIVPSLWRAVCAMNKRHEVLLVASAGDSELVAAYVEETVLEYERRLEHRARKNAVLPKL